MSEDYYNLLNVSKSASADEIKKSYRKLAIKWHPDKNKGDANAEEKFKKISEAYDVLSDESKRQSYDQFGHDAFQSGRGGHGGFHGGNDPFDMFNSFFGGGGGNSNSSGFDGFFTRENGRRARKKNPGSNLKLDIEVTLLDITREKNINLSYTRNDRCNMCDGTGNTSSSTTASCGSCGGRGSVYRSMGIMQIEQPCGVCGGSGTIIKNPCNRCVGSGIKSKKINTSIKIPIGCHNGLKLRVSGMGNYDKGGFGDLYVFVHVKSEEEYDRDGDDLYRKLSIDFEDMILGKVLELDSLYGNVKVKIPKFSKPDQVLKVKDFGIPNMNTHNKGDMFLVLSPKLPNELSSEQEKILELFRNSK